MIFSFLPLNMLLYEVSEHHEHVITNPGCFYIIFVYQKFEVVDD